VIGGIRPDQERSLICVFAKTGGEMLPRPKQKPAEPGGARPFWPSPQQRACASCRLNRNIELFGRVENLLDSDYEEVLGYSTAPISAFGGVRMTFEAEGPLEAALK
jgi:hypothetical protein